MDLTIIIVNWNARDLLTNCLHSIEAHSGDLEVQTIVVDNNSADGSPEAVSASFPNVELINSGGNIGFARANNLALSSVRSPLVLFLNPDTEIKDNALQLMVEHMTLDPSAGALGCKIRDVSGDLQQLGIQWFPTPWRELIKMLVISQWTLKKFPRLFPTHDPETSGYITKLFGACLLVRKEVLDTVGSFDERYFMYCEDVDLCHRVSLAGWKLYYLAEGEILHLGAGSSDKAPGAFAVLMTCESFEKLMLKYYGASGGAAYRFVVFTGAQARLVMLYCMKIFGALMRRLSGSALAGAVTKYVTMTRWTLGLEKPVIRE